MTLLCALCLTGECLHAVPEEHEPGARDCADSEAVTFLNGTALCSLCANGRISIERQLAFQEMNRAADSTSHSTGSNDPIIAEANRGNVSLDEQPGGIDEFFAGFRPLRPDKPV